MPGVMLLSFGLMRLLGVPLPTPQFTFLTVITMSLAFFAGALCEELGWSGYVIDPMQDRWGAFRAGVLLGLVWAAWHVIPLMQAHRSSPWIAWWCLGTVTTRVLMVWLYNNTGRSVFGAALFHASLNVAWQLFPIHGSEYDPRVTGLIVAVAAAFVTIVYGPRTLTGYKNT
jgi:membrane protease YdiL (CAAX protease family)